MICFLLTILLLLGLAPASAAVLTATPTTISAQLAAAKAGDTVKLGAGLYDPITIFKRAYDPPLTVDAGIATLPWVKIQSSSGITWSGGIIEGGSPAPIGYGLHVLQSNRITVDRLRVNGARKAVLFDRVQDFALTNSALLGFTTDGLNAALSQRGRIAGNVMASLGTGEQHPDCGQLWSAVGNITSDIVFEDNLCVGKAQGFTAFNSAGMPGFDRITFRRNQAIVTFGQALSVNDCRDCTVIGNTARSLVGSLVRPVVGPKVNAAVNFARSAGTLCGNVAADVKNSPAAKACP